jgi:hypothetical protein
LVSDGPAAGPSAEFLTKRQLEDAAMPRFTRPRELYLVFKKPAAVTSGSN